MAASPNTKLKVRIGDKEVELEGEPEHVAKVIAHLLAQGASGVVVSPTEGQGKPPPGSPVGPPVLPDIRTFFKEKQPTSDNEATAAVAYYYKFVAPAEERKDTIDKDVLEEAFRLADWPYPKSLVMALVHAKDAGYLSQTERGIYRLTTVGHNLVAHSLGAAGKGKATPRRRAKRKSKPKRPRKK